MDVEERPANNGNKTQEAQAEKPQHEKANATEQKQQQMETEAPVAPDSVNMEQEQVAEGLQNMDIQVSFYTYACSGFEDLREGRETKRY